METPSFRSRLFAMWPTVFVVLISTLTIVPEFESMGTVVATSASLRWGDQKTLSQMNEQDTFVNVEHQEDSDYTYHSTGFVSNVPGSSRPSIGRDGDGEETAGNIVISQEDGLLLKMPEPDTESVSASESARGERPCEADCGMHVVSEGVASLGKVSHS